MRALTLALALVWLAGCDASVLEEPPPDGRYSAAEIDYFVEVALGSEYGGNTPQLRRWAGDVRVSVLGAPTAEDLRALGAVVSDLNGLIGPVSVVVTDERPTVTLRFLPPREFAAAEPNYVPGNLGFFYVYWTGGCEIVRGNVLIATEGVSPSERAHLIREELTQSLGLMRDSGRYPASIFYEPWTDVTAYAPIDRAVIEMMYRPEVRPCMDERAVRRQLAAVPAGG